MTQATNKPAGEVRDGAIKATIWRNQSEKGVFYSVEITRTYVSQEETATTKAVFADSHSFSGADVLRVSILTQEAYRKVIELKQLDAMDRKVHQHNAA